MVLFFKTWIFSYCILVNIFLSDLKILLISVIIKSYKIL